MVKGLTFCLLPMACLVIAASGSVAEVMDNPAEIVDICATANQLDQRVSHYQQFRATLYATVNELGKGQTSLSEAIVRVQNSAEVFNPIYLKTIHTTDPGRTTSECIARNLIGHVREAAQDLPSYSEQAQSLDAELAGMLSGTVQKG